jgi:hypothetical protein
LPPNEHRFTGPAVRFADGGSRATENPAPGETLAATTYVIQSDRAAPSANTIEARRSFATTKPDIRLHSTYPSRFHSPNPAVPM